MNRKQLLQETKIMLITYSVFGCVLVVLFKATGWDADVGTGFLMGSMAGLYAGKAIGAKRVKAA